MPNDNGSFAGKVAFVTGAANGIGRGDALAFARRGARVLLADVSDQSNQETARMIEDLGRRALAIRCDVSQGEDVKVVGQGGRSVRTPRLRFQQRRGRTAADAYG